MAPLKIAKNSDWGEFGHYSLKSSEAWILFQILYFNLKMYTYFELERIPYLCLF